jgi:chromate reductase
MTPRIRGIAGSLRATSFNHALLRAAIERAPDGVVIAIFDGLGAIPPRRRPTPASVTPS